MISVAECGRLRKRLRDSTGNGRKLNELNINQDIEEVDEAKQVEIKDEEQRVTKKQRPTYTEDFDGVAIHFSQNKYTNYRNDNIKKIDVNNIQIDNNNGRINNRNDHEI